MTTNFFPPLSFVAVFGSGIRDPRWVKIRIRDKLPGSATLPQCFFIVHSSMLSCHSSSSSCCSSSPPTLSSSLPSFSSSSPNLRSTAPSSTGTVFHINLRWKSQRMKIHRLGYRFFIDLLIHGLAYDFLSRSPSFLFGNHKHLTDRIQNLPSSRPS
jgi:hypothetical protein